MKKRYGKRTPAFKPTKAHRKVVEQLIALHVRYFKRELAAGGAMLKELAASKYFQALEAGESWAIRMAMRNRFNWGR
jgi:hypothetical protein